MALNNFIQYKYIYGIVTSCLCPFAYNIFKEPVATIAKCLLDKNILERILLRLIARFLGLQVRSTLSAN